MTTVVSYAFKATFDTRRGGQMTGLWQHDGLRWNQVLGADKQAFPGLLLTVDGAPTTLDGADAPVLLRQSGPSESVILATTVHPKKADLTAAPATVTLTFEVHREGAIFVSIDAKADRDDVKLTHAAAGFAVDRRIAAAPRFRTHRVPSAAGPNARIAFGMGNVRSFTNELELMLEDGATGAPSPRELPAGAFEWTLTADPGGHALKNRLALGVGAQPGGTSMTGQRPFHWVNIRGARKDSAAWYPTNAEIDAIAARRATILILHHRWMAREGTNGAPHAAYGQARDDAELRRVITHAHDKGLRVGLYMRGVERYGLDTHFVEKYLTPELDGLYVDWHGANIVSLHEHDHAEDAALDDHHFAKDGRVLAAHDYFLFTKRLRELVGRRGFLIGHQGSGASGILANLAMDAYLPGESAHDHAMMKNVDDAVFSGMGAASVTLPWPVDAPHAFTTKEAVAKMAAWGIFPDVPLGIFGFPEDPSSPVNAYALPYWNLLAAGHAEDATVWNSPASALVAARSSNPRIRAMIYAGSDEWLVVLANLAPEPASAHVTLLRDVLSLPARMKVQRIDPASGLSTHQGYSDGSLDTGELPPYGLAGFRLTR